MTRSELLNSAEYWQEKAENECWREGIECKLHLIDSNKLQQALINKDTLVAEIKKRLLPVATDKHYDEWERGQDSERIAILDIINTLEVKEVNLDKEMED